MMNLDKLEVGMVVRNYQTLCELLGEKVKKSNDKIAQIKQLETHVKFEKMGNSFKILEIYTTQLKIIDNRDTGNNSLYQMHLQVTLLDYLARAASQLEDDFQVMELTNSKIIGITGMANEYYLNKEKDKFLLEDCNISEFHLNDFYRNTGIKFCRIIGSALTNLKSRCLLNIKDKYKICEDDEWRTADNQEETTIIEAKRIALLKMGLKTEIQVRMKFKMVEFYKIVNDILATEQNWNGCYKYYQVSFHQSTMNEKIEHHKIEIEEKKKQQHLLNDKIISYLNKDTENRYIKNMKEIKELEDKFLYYEEDTEEVSNALNNKFRYQTTFVEDQKQIIKQLISI